jgi:hypothetical protein
MLRLLLPSYGVKPKHSAFHAPLRSSAESFGTIVVGRLDSGGGTKDMRVGIASALAIMLVASVMISPTSAASGQPDRAERAHKTYDVYFPNVAVPPDAGISLVRIVVTCGRIAAVTRIPDDWYVRTLRPAAEPGREWSEFKLASNAVDFEAGHGVTHLRNLRSLDGVIKVAVEDDSCFDIVADIKDDMADDGWKVRLRRAQLRLRN